jgi:hypothetical protein
MEGPTVSFSRHRSGLGLWQCTNYVLPDASLSSTTAMLASYFTEFTEKKPSLIKARVEVSE